MAQHARTITREDLLHRYANACRYTFGEAHDLAANLSNRDLQNLVETIERLRNPSRGRRQSFARSQPTTSLDGQTR